MPGIYSSLHNAGDALDAFTRVLQVTQNNVANASTPGYARQRAQLYALPFDPANGVLGGVQAGDIQTSRDSYAEHAVRSETSSLGFARQKVSGLDSLQQLFDISGDSGLPYALNNLFRSFSAWAQSPNGSVARQTVLDRAADAAAAFRRTASGIARASADTEQQLRQAVDQVNHLTANLAGYNQKAIEGGGRDAGLDARIHATLEELSEYADVATVEQDNGSVCVLLAGQVPLVLGNQQFTLAYDVRQSDDPDAPYPSAPPTARIASNGRDITARIAAGRLGALLDLRNQVIPSLVGDARQAGGLNILARQFAGRINSILTSGVLSPGPAPESGVPLFVYDTENDTNAAQTLAVDPAIDATRLAAADPGPPQTANGVPLRLSALASPQSADDEIDGASFTGYFGLIAARVGSALAAARDAQQVGESAVAQAKSLRTQMSGVSLDEEAMVLIEFQRAYQANSRLVSILDQLTEETINMLQV